MAQTVRVAVTGAAGQVAYSMLARLASGEVFGADTKVTLQLLEITPAMQALEGVAMELEDCGFATLEKIVVTDDPNAAFAGVNVALLVGSMPRKEGMERKELLGANGKIFVGQGKALEKNAAADVRALVVGNPCNTNALILMNNARNIPRDRFFAMTRLDENRAKAQLAQKASVDITAVTNLAIWGNHSATMYPDFFNARIGTRPVPDVIKHTEWLEKDFITTVQQRGAAIIKARGLSSAASAANAAIDTVRSLVNPTPAGDWTSVAVCGDGSYGIEKGLMFSYPIRSTGKSWEIVQDVPLNEFSRAKIAVTENELKEEKALVSDLIPK
jgi:malate dehydrogenase